MNSTASALLSEKAFGLFAFAGNALFTVESKATGTRFTVKIRQPKENGPHFCSVLTGPNNENDFEFVGTVFPSGDYRHGKRSRITEVAPSAKAVRWIVERALLGKPLNGCEVFHSGKCGKCGRTLTVPESIESGIGPECAKKMGL